MGHRARTARTRRRAAGRWGAVVVAGAALVAACTSGDGGSGGGGDAGAGGDPSTTAPTTTTTAPLGPADASLAPALAEPRDLVDALSWFELPYGIPDSDFTAAPRGRARVDDLTIEPAACAEIVGGYIASTGPGPTVNDIVAPANRLVIEQRVDREAGADDRWEALDVAITDACADATVTTPDGGQGTAAPGNHHVVQAGVTLRPLAIDLTTGDGSTLRGHVMFVFDAEATHVISVFSTEAASATSSEEVYDIAHQVAVPMQRKLDGTVG
jgi:hypothetical protein